MILPASIFDILEHTGPGAGGEIQLTDAMRELCIQEGMYAVDFEGTRYDMGSKLGFLIANVREGVKNEEVSDEFKAFLKATQSGIIKVHPQTRALRKEMIQLVCAKMEK